MNTAGSKNFNLGGILGSFEDDFEIESSFVSTITSTAKDMAGGVYEAALDLSKTVVVAESKKDSPEERFSMDGSINNFKDKQAKIEQLEKQAKERKEIDRKKTFFQSFKENMERARMAKDKLLLEEEINDIATNLPTEEKNALLHYQASYRDRSIYQRAELRKKIIEQRNKNEKQEKAAEIPSPAKQPSAMEGAFEGRSGTQGGGTANLSAQAVG